MPRSLWSNRSFNGYWLGRIASDFGDWLAVIALPLVILHITGSLVWMGVVTALQSAGGWLGGLVATVVADRFDRKTILIVSDVIQAALYALITWAGIRAWPEIRDLVLVCTPILAAIAALFDATSVPFLDQVLETPAHRLGANARIQATRSIAGLVAPLSLGSIVALWGPFSTLGLNAASFALSAISLACVTVRRPVVVEPPRALSFHELSGGFRFLFGSKLFLWVVLLSAIYRAIGSSANDLVIFHVTKNLGLPPTAVGVLVMAIGVGYLVGSVIVPTLRRRLGFGACFLGSFVISAGAMFALGWTTQLGPMAWGAGIYGASFMFFHVPSLTLRQALPPTHLQGRVAAATGLIFVTASGIGAAGGSVLGDYVGVPWTMTVMAAGCLLLVAVGLWSPARKRDPGSELTPSQSRGL